MKNSQRGSLVSVVMPVRQGKYLDLAVKSLCNQDYAELELIVIDDGCSTADLAKIRNYDSRIKIYANQGEGLVDALNTGLSKAGGGFIARMDADDICTPDRISTQLKLLASMPQSSIVAGQVEIFKTEGELEQGYKIYQEWINSLTSPDEIAREIFVESPLPHPTILMPSAIVDTVGHYRDGPWPEDYDYWLRAHALGVSFAKPEKILLKWRDDSDRTSRNDDRYSRSCFMGLKARYVEKLVRGRDIYIWGTGKTGCDLFDALHDKKIRVSGFLDLHPRRVGQKKRNIPVYDYRHTPMLDGVILCAVSARGVRAEIRSFMDEHNKTETQDYWFFA